MDTFNAPELINLLEISSKLPRERILNLFDIENKEKLIEIDQTNTNTIKQILVEYIATQASQMGAENPTMLAEHIVLIARNAAVQATKEASNAHLAHAKKAAEALILAQTQKELTQTSHNRTALYGAAASVILLGVSALWFKSAPTSPSVNITNRAYTPTSTKTISSTEDQNKLTAHDAVAMYEKFDQMRTGTCQYPEAIQIPDQDKAVYLESVVGGKLPTNLTDLATANKYLAIVRCNYTPMLMAKSK